MTITQAIFIGVIQGITEFLPISSSGHLIFIPQFLGWADQGLAFDAIIHLGTLLAVILYFRARILSLILSLKKEGSREDRRLLFFVLISIVPALIVGFLLQEVLLIEIRSPVVIAIHLIVWGIVLGIADHYGKRGNGLESLTFGKTAFIACAQALALIPGTSRSGITMTAGLFSKLSRSVAAEFSFLMSIPVITAAGGLKLVQIVASGQAVASSGPLVMGLIAATISGLFAIWGLMKIIQKWSFMPFAVYRVLVGLGILLILV